jgi:hypothetical protein
MDITRSVIHPRLGEIDLVAQPCEITGFDREIRTATPDLGKPQMKYSDRSATALKRSQS